MPKILEIACFTGESALMAQEAGADRIELCQNYTSGGLTATKEMMIFVRKNIRIPVYAIIRPRAGNFVYSNSELNEMKNSIELCKELKFNGLVFGCLTAENEIDETTCKELLALAYPLPVTFHRAIDLCNDLSRAIQMSAKLGFERVLTSGGKNNAYNGKVKLESLNKMFNKSIILMPGGGIRSENISEILKTTGCNEFHSAAITNDTDVCDANEIKKLKRVIHSNL